MAAELVETSPAFRASIEACAAALQRYGVDLMAEFAKPDGWSTPALAMSGLSAVQARWHRLGSSCMAQCEAHKARSAFGWSCRLACLHSIFNRLGYGEASWKLFFCSLCGRHELG